MKDKLNELRAITEELGRIRGRHTELVSVYVPAGYGLAKVVEQIRSEQGTAMNIKSKAVRKNVTSALEKILQHLKLYKETPQNGLAIFCGNVSDKEGVADLEIWAVEPPEPLKTKLYRCDQAFVLDPLRDMIREREIYGLILFDKSEATIGILKGKKIEVLKHLESIVPGKTRAGGWCVHEDTLMPMGDGKILPVKEIGNEEFLSFDFRSGMAVKSKHNHYSQRKSDNAFKIITHQPRIEIAATPEHNFFVVGEKGIITKHLEDLKKGERLLAVKKINISGGRIALPAAKSKGIKFPSEVNKKLAQFLGYMIGDGCIERDRITLFDANPDLLKVYQEISKEVFGVPGSMKERKGRNYWHLRIYGRELVNKMQKYFPEAARSFEKDIPPAINMLENGVLAGFLRGLFDAEGYVNSSSLRVGITTNREFMMRSLQVMLLRFGVISSFGPVSGKSFAKKQKYCITIDDRESLERFSSQIGFSGKKAEALGLMIKKRSRMSRVDQVPIDGRYVRNLVKSLKMNSSDFPEAGTMYLLGKRQMSRQVFEKNVIRKVEKRIQELRSSPEDAHELRKLVRMKYDEIARILGVSTSTVFGNMKNGWNVKAARKAMGGERRSMIKEGKDVIRELRNALNSDAISVKIGSITPAESKGLFYDMEIPKHENFIANGIIIHNSANRYARIREGMLNDFMKKVGDIASQSFKEFEDFLGLIIGGPGPVKEQFAEGDYLDYTIKDRIIGVVDTSYTGEPGLREILERAEEMLSEASVTKERKLLERFFGELGKDSGLAVYGLKETIEATEAGNLELMIISEDFDWVRFGFECPACGEKFEKVLDRKQAGSQKCKCGEKPNIVSERELTEEIVESAEKIGTTVYVVSSSTGMGEQLKELGGIVGILRYRKE